ncbi:hypothetical protein D9M71_830050 [compost metagenome]
MVVRVEDFLRELINHGQEVWIDNRAVTNTSGVLQLLAKHAGRGLIRLGREVDHETFGS